MSLAFYLVLAYVGLLFIRPQEYFPALQDVPIMPAVMGAAFAAWLPQRGKRLDAPQYWLVLVLALVIAFSVAVNGWAGGGVKALGEFLPIAVLFILVASSTATLGRHRAFMAVLGVCAMILAVHGIDQKSVGIGWSGAELSQGTRITYIGIFNDPNDIALAFVIALPMLALRLSESRGFTARLVWLACMGCVLYGVYLTNSRGGMLSVIAQFGLFAVSRYGPLKSVFPVAACLAIVSLFGPSRLDNLDPDEESAEGRVEAWYTGIWMLIRNPVFGVGKGNFTDHHYLAAHNTYVLAFAELGLFGYFFWVAFVALCVYMVWVASRAGPAPDGLPAAEAEEREHCRTVARTYLYAMVGYLVGGMFLSRSYNPILFLMCALCVAIYQVMRTRWPSTPAVTFRAMALPLLAIEIGSIVFMYLVTRVLL